MTGVQTCALPICKEIKDQKTEGPDFQFIYKGRNYYIEATAPGMGTGKYRLPIMEYNEILEEDVKICTLPKDKFLLRQIGRASCRERV